jgi:hypothetical protein
MNDENAQQPVNILLSQKELQVVLDLLETDYIPGLDADPLGNLTAEQQSLALTVANHALQARELVQVQERGKLVVHNTLLTAVGVCAYSQKSIFVYHWPTNAENPTRYFGHIREDNIVAHTRPEDILHLFSVLPSKDQLVEQVLAVCEYRQVPASPAHELTVPGEDFAMVRLLADAGDTEKAIGLLTNNETPANTARALAVTLATSPRVSIMQTLKYVGAESIQKRDFTLLQNGQHTWLVIAPPGEADGTPLRVKTTTKDEVRALLAEWL